ncbi:phospholipase B1, membrane-associated-like isoform X2 [Hyla sarda]|uniref:phospholipase B1, membrane-associated-like isoform X2 n=1 Tax=Hyla sarda TaxID=327740 RepID=UPI0024C45933|nr:phospholipase B1, membrane-associated-like isoform X2 [Hyla sarda]
MAAAQVTVIICCLYLRQVCGLDWMGNYMDGLKDHMTMFGLQQFPEKSTGWSREGKDFYCPYTAASPEPPTTADRVRPGDVKIVAALGDSLTAAIGANATNVLEIPTEYRHLSWSIGGYSNLSAVITLPNILKTFNPNVVGFGKRSTVSYRPAPLEDSGLNLAVTGANTFLLPAQARRLIDVLNSLPDISVQDDWKVITIFIGSNDLCDYCKNKTQFSADAFIHHMSEALDMLQEELSRSIVNVVQLFQVDRLRQVNDQSLGCILQRFFCSCVVSPKEDSPELLELLEVNRQFQDRLEHLIQTSGRYDGKKDFAVILQPFLKDIEPAIDHDGIIDFSFFTPDCFHLTVKGHEQMAKGLWNNMVTAPNAAMSTPCAPLHTDNRMSSSMEIRHAGYSSAGRKQISPEDVLRGSEAPVSLRGSALYLHQEDREHDRHV